jgi:3-oxoacyl-[acyl-carrier protein] reductase
MIFNDGYSAANRAVSLLTETWAREAAPEVRVNELMLGFFETRHAQDTRGWGLLSPAEQQAIIAHTLVGRTGQHQDVIKAVRYLLEDGDYVTGATLRLDGGYVLGGSKVPPMPKGVE